MLAAIRTANIFGATGHPLTVEVHVGAGVPGFSIVGLPDESCREARDRVRAAVLSSGLEWPNRKITVNLAPASMRKSGHGLDLPLAVGVLVAAERIPAAAVEGIAFIGELGLDGSLRSVAGGAPLVAAVADLDVVVPIANAAEACLATDRAVRAVRSLAELVGVLAGDDPWPLVPTDEPCSEARTDRPPAVSRDLCEVRGQPVAVDALIIAATGRHHLLFSGPPGSGKSMLAQRLAGLLPPLNRRRSLEATMIHSAAGLLTGSVAGLVTEPPFRAPHHSASLVSMVGGGSNTMRPGEISLAHGGVLFLDEMGEFSPQVLDGLRQPLEERVVRISRAQLHVTMDADVMLVGATNPCPCGGGRGEGDCMCSEPSKARYLRRLSGPLLDRFDLRVTVHRPSTDALLGVGVGPTTAEALERIIVARARAERRGLGPNGLLNATELDEVAALTPRAQRLLRSELERGRLSGRGLHRVRRVARTIADLDGDVELIDDGHIQHALSLRSPLDHPRAEWAA